MAGKYTQLDRRLLEWLGSHRSDVTTAGVIAGLELTEPRDIRHVSRRFTQLEDRRVLACKLHGTTRICSVLQDPPTTLAKAPWRSTPIQEAKPQPVRSVPAQDSEEFLAAGGTIERLPAAWDRGAVLPHGSLPLGHTANGGGIAFIDNEE